MVRLKFCLRRSAQLYKHMNLKYSLQFLEWILKSSGANSVKLVSLKMFNDNFAKLNLGIPDIILESLSDMLDHSTDADVKRTAVQCLYSCIVQSEQYRQRITDLGFTKVIIPALAYKDVEAKRYSVKCISILVESPSIQQLLLKQGLAQASIQCLVHIAEIFQVQGHVSDIGTLRFHNNFRKRCSS